jgi:hypothetical protein
MFGGVALFAVIFFASGMPRIKEDILQVCHTWNHGRHYGQIADPITEDSLRWAPLQARDPGLGQREHTQSDTGVIVADHDYSRSKLLPFG